MCACVCVSERELGRTKLSKFRDRRQLANVPRSCVYKGKELLTHRVVMFLIHSMCDPQTVEEETEESGS